jgi:hypothetical protein
VQPCTLPELQHLKHDLTSDRAVRTTAGLRMVPPLQRSIRRARGRRPPVWRRPLVRRHRALE